MNLLNVIALLLFSIVSIGCSLEVATFKSEPPVSSDKPVFKSLVKHKLTGDFTANIQTFERYHASATDDAGNLYLMGTSVISNYGPVVRAFTATGEDKIDFGNQGYLYPGNAISILDSVSSTPLALSVIKKNGKTQIAVTIGVQTSIVYPNFKRGLKTLFFSPEGKLLHTSPSIYYDPSYYATSARSLVADNHIYIALNTYSDSIIAKMDLQGNPDLSFGDSGHMVVPGANYQSTLELLGDGQPILLAANFSGSLVCYRLHSQGPSGATILNGMSYGSGFKFSKIHDDLLLIVDPYLKVLGIDKECQSSSSVNTSVSGYSSSDYALGGVLRESNNAADIYLVKRSDREIVKVHFNTTGLTQTVETLPEMHLAPSRTGTSNKYGLHRQGKDLTLISFEDNLALAGSYNVGYSQSMETSLHRIDLDSKTIDSSWGVLGRRFLNEPKKVSLLDLYQSPIATKSHIYFHSSFADESYTLGYYIFRVHQDGRLDTSFGVNGLLRFNSSIFHIIETEEADVLVVTKSGAYGSEVTSIFKYSSNGQLDSNFGVSGVFEVPVPSQLDRTHHVFKDGKFYFISTTSAHPDKKIRSLNLNNGSLVFDRTISHLGTYDRALSLYADKSGKVILESGKVSAPPDLLPKAFKHEVSSDGTLSLMEEITFDLMPQYSLPSKGTDLFYEHSYNAGVNVTLMLKIYNNNGSLISDTSAVFKNLIEGQVLNDRYNGLPFAFGIFDAGSYYFGRVVIYDRNGKILERLFDSMKIHKTFVSSTNLFYLIEKQSNLSGNAFYLVPLEGKEFEEVQ